MTGLSNYSAQNLLNYLVGAAAMPALPASEWLALFTAVGTDAGGMVEPGSGTGYLRSQIAGSLSTTSATTSGSPDLNITGVPAWIQTGMLVSDTTSSGSIPPSTFVISKTTNTVTLSNILPAVASGDSIRFTSFGLTVTGATYSIVNGSRIVFPQATAPGYGVNPAFGIFDASGGGNMLTWDFFGLYDWNPFSSTSGISGNGATFLQAGHGFSNGNGIIVSPEFGGTLPTTTQGTLSGYALNYAANVAGDSYTLSSSSGAPSSGNAVWASNAGGGQARRVDPVVVPTGVQPIIPPSSLYMSIFAAAPALPTGAATFISPINQVVSSLESGRMVHIHGWGGNEFGYSVTYALDGTQPSGVTIDTDTGVLSIVSGLSVGDHSFGVITTNIRNTFLQSTHTFTLNVLQGITSGTPTSGQILHKTYDPLGGVYGSPSGNNFTTVFGNINAAILTDQLTYLEDHLRCFIPLRKGRTYQYTDNKFVNGIRYFDLALDPAFSASGAAPIMQNIVSDPGQQFPYDDGPINYGAGSIMFAGHGIHAFSAAMAFIASGATSGVATSGANMLIPGRWHQIMGQCIQDNGEPSNVAWIDYVIITAVVGNNVFWDRPTKYYYRPEWWEIPGADAIIGAARIVPWDCGGASGTIPGEKRATMRAYFQGMNWLGNPNALDAGSGQATICYLSNTIMMTIEDSNVLNAQFTMSKDVLWKNCVVQGSEPDKQMETITFQGCTSASGTSIGEVGGATGAQYLFTLDSALRCWQMKPRQWRSLRTSHSAANDVFLSLPVTFAFQGPALDYIFEGCTFLPGPNSNSWTYQKNPDPAAVVGTDLTYSGGVITVPNTSNKWEDWLCHSYEGMIVATSGCGPFDGSRWGYCTTMGETPSGAAVTFNVTWVSGAPPTNGTGIWFAEARSLYFAANNQFVSGSVWADPGAARQTTVPNQPNWDFPPGYPVIYQQGG